MVSLENIHTSTAIQTKQVIFRNTHVLTSTYMYAITSETRGHEFEEEQVRV